MGRRSDYCAARRANEAEKAPATRGVPRLVPLFPVRAQDAERVCGHTGELPSHTRFWCPCCNKTGAVYERRLQDALARALNDQQADDDRIALERIEKQEARLGALARGRRREVKQRKLAKSIGAA